MPGAGEAVPHLLILGGTEEAYALATALATGAAGCGELRVTSSLAGLTTAPRLPAGVVRLGGFGGAEGLEAWLLAHDVALVVDATHPFATRISRQAAAAATATGRRYLRLERPGWQAEAGDRWHRAADLRTALQRLEELGARRVFAALGARAVPALAGSSMRFVVRGIEPPTDLPANVAWASGRGPFALADELRLLAAERIDTLLARDSGGKGAKAKLLAARQLGLPAVLIDRPPPPPGTTVPNVAAALEAVQQLL